AFDEHPRLHVLAEAPVFIALLLAKPLDLHQVGYHCFQVTITACLTVYISLAACGPPAKPKYSISSENCWACSRFQSSQNAGRRCAFTRSSWWNRRYSSVNFPSSRQSMTWSTPCATSCTRIAP